MLLMTVWWYDAGSCSIRYHCSWTQVDAAACLTLSSKTSTETLLSLMTR